MIFAPPALEPVDREVVGMINAQRQLLKYQVSQSPNRWQGFLRRNTFARALQGSKVITPISRRRSPSLTMKSLTHLRKRPFERWWVIERR